MVHLCPCTLKEARAFVQRHHRHARAPQGGLFAVAATDSQEIIGVAIVGRPIARQLDDGWTAEVTRLCTLGARNIPSMLYGACWRAARALGYRRLITYTLACESGASLRASGFKVVAKVKAESWHRERRPRVDLSPLQAKLRWQMADAAEGGEGR